MYQKQDPWNRNNDRYAPVYQDNLLRKMWLGLALGTVLSLAVVYSAGVIKEKISNAYQHVTNKVNELEKILK